MATINSIFITGIGTGVGKTFVASLLAKGLEADYWKPIQAGIENTDKEEVQKHLGSQGEVHPETYLLQEASSPHIAAQKEQINISLSRIEKDYLAIRQKMGNQKILLIEGVGGLLSPINDHEQNIHLIKRLQTPVIIVSKNYLGSINHSLLTSQILQQHQISILGWIFNGAYCAYEKDIVQWSGIPEILSIPLIDANTPPQELKLEQIKALLK